MVEHYRIFKTVAEAGQISKAAKLLFISQPAVSQSIKALEAQLSCQLFKRTPKGVALTQEGMLFYQEIKLAFEHIQKAEKIIEDAKHLEVGEITIGASDSVCQHYLLDIIVAYKTQYPQIKVHVYNKTSYQVVKLLEAGQIDIGFVHMPLGLPENVASQVVKPLQDCFVCSPSFDLNVDENHTLAAILSQPLILLEEGTNMRMFLDRYVMAQSLTYTPAYELGSADLLVAFAKRQLGIAFVTEDFCRDALDRKDLVKVKLDQAFAPRNISMVTMTQSRHSCAAKAFKALVLEEFKYE